MPRSMLLEYSKHASITMDNQPFLFAGDLALTAVKGQKDASGEYMWSIQVHRVFGNQANEFTVIPLNQGIPSLGPCTTASNCDNVAAACQSGTGCKAAIPYGYDVSVNGHVIGATTQRYLFWATNPSLEPFTAFADYCATRDKNNTGLTQISVTSSYGGIRLWRINPYLFCPVDPTTGKQVCPEQQSADSRQISLLDFNGDFADSMCDETLDVMAVDMDYINEDNIAVTLLRTTLTNVNTLTLRPLNASKAEWVTVFVNPETMETREDKLWMPEASSPALTQGVLCPNQRRMPNFGSLSAELIAGGILFLRMPFNVILTFPIMNDVADGNCPVFTAGHSMLKQCGADLLSLEDFFSAVFRANTLFWQTFAIIADSFGPGPPQTFINGIAITGENGGWASMIPGMAQSFSSVSSMDVGKASTIVSSTVSTLPQPIALAQITMKNPIAYSYYFYRLASRMLMQIVQASKGGRTLPNVFWNVISDGVQDFELIVLQRMRRTCGGYGMMAGFSSPLGRMMNHWCIANVESQAGMLTMATVFFVDVPLMDCICIRSKGSNFQSFVRANCWPDTPDLMKPLVNSLINMGDDACPTLVAMTQSRFKESMDPMFARAEAGIREVGSLLDWFIHSNYVGDCNNFADNPYVLALIPHPVDYFRVCGKTTACRLRCLSEIQAFEARNFEPLSTEVITKTVQSMYFNSQDSDTLMPLRPLAMLELFNCSHACGFVQTIGPYRDRCFLLAGEGGNGMLQVINFCVPIQLGANVRRGGGAAGAWTIDNLVPGAKQVGLVFLPDPFDFWRSFQMLAITDDAIWVCRETCVRLFGIAQFAADVVRLRRFAILGNHVIVDAMCPLPGTEFSTTSRTYCILFSGYEVGMQGQCDTNIWDTTMWPVCTVDENNNCEKVMLLPRAGAEKVQICSRNIELSPGILEGCMQYDTGRDFVYKASLSGTGIVSQSTLLQGDGSVWNVFMTTPPDQVSHWLLSCKVAIAPGGSVVGTTARSVDSSADIQVMRQCSLDNCVGCKDLGLQRICYAAQQCQLGRCIGTIVHQRRPLCAIGMNLQALLEQQLQLFEGAWLVISDSMVTILALSGGVEAPVAVTWPDQAFYGYICAAKDVSATAISIVVSSLNGIVLTAGEMPVGSQGDQLISNSALVLYTMTMAATTNFLHQIALYPLYGMIAMQKTFICSTNSVLAVAGSVIGPNGPVISIGDPAIQKMSDKGAGVCMSQFFAESLQGGGDETEVSDNIMNGILGQMVNTALAMRLDFAIHPMDASLTWMQGVVSGLQDVVQTIDRNKCKLPDYSAKDSFQCACGDSAYSIIPARQLDTAATQGFWCSSTLTMMNYDGTTKYVWNPYSLQELTQMLMAPSTSGKSVLDEYLMCVATGGSCNAPTAPIFSSQQVSMIAVYQRCLANYQSRQWDMGAHVMFNLTLQAQMDVVPAALDCFPIPQYTCLSECLLHAASEVTSNSVCLDLWLTKRGITSLDFFEYEMVNTPAPMQSHQVHACQVFSGPAALGGPVAVPYRKCLDEYEDTGICHIPHIVWSGRSSNKVPVGVDHATVIANPEMKLQAANTAYAKIKSDVLGAIDDLADWAGNDISVSIFSAEGDLLHQFFDCLMIGALDDVDLWPGPDVAKPVWSRNRLGVKSRDFQLPCSGDALNDRLGVRDSKSPFTCGSNSRRSAIKYFLRNGANADGGTNRVLVVDAVKVLLAELKKAWDVDISDYMCQCIDGSHSVDCCVLESTCDPEILKCPCDGGLVSTFACCAVQCTESSLLPPGFQVAFTSIPGSKILDGLLDSVWTYVSSTVWLNNSAWLQYDRGGSEAYNWTKDALQLPVDHGLFDTTSAVSAYDHTELGYPFKTTVWAMCHGLLQQVHFTMPMENGKPVGINDAYDPDGTSTVMNVTYREDFTRRLTLSAYRHSPLFWHYHSRHKPSQSAICKRSQPRWPNSVNDTYFAHGYASMTLGGYEVDCYCGWWFNSTHCQIPPAVCERLVLLIGSEVIQEVCRTGGVTENALLLHVMPDLVALEGGWKDWPCPAMHVSDHWGIMEDQTAWVKGGRNLTGIYDKVLRFGPSGLRVGSLPWMLGAHIRHINPSQRTESVQPQQCALFPPRALVDNFVDELFPAAQGVRQSSAVSSCMRFSIEVARLSAYQEANLMLAAADQTAMVAIWRRRCDMKIKQVSFCSVYGVFDVQQTAAGCKFAVSLTFQRSEYSVTPGCLVIYKGKVFDPCLCDVKWCSPSSDFLFPYTLDNAGSLCRVYHVRDMVNDSDTHRVPWPADSATDIPRALARSSFLSDILQAESNVANNQRHWATAEGDDSFHYCDLVVDWWPDNWKHPVGYHVTLPCKNAAHRTFDASWAALRVGSQVSMVHVPSGFRNKTMQTNQFGAAGACRTHNYGMPMKTLNTMRFCTQADNRPADPTVPFDQFTQGGAADWGLEYCTSSPFDTPWAQSPNVKSPSSVGTHFNYLVDLIPFTSWGSNAGHAPFRACAADADCCATCKCLVSKSGGICAIIQPDTFECSQHQHCVGKLCAGDGTCVHGLLEIMNNATFDISARIYAAECTADAWKVDTWGMSKEDTVPDIMNASGMCSYRSWFEHRRLKSCTASQCTIHGTDPWMFSSAETTPAAAFESEVLAVLPHSCDRDYEHMKDLWSCSPTSAQSLLRNAFGETVTLARGTRTQTYRNDQTLQIVRHAGIDNMGLGFLGVPKTYKEAGYATMGNSEESHSLQACSAFGLCGDQASASMWYVNGIMEFSRTVTLGDGSVRPYDTGDMLRCGSMGFVVAETTSCRIDAAVFPLFYVYCTANGALSMCSSSPQGLYPQGKNKVALRAFATNLNSLFQTMRSTPDTWGAYLTAVDDANRIWADIAAQNWKAAYPNALVSNSYKGLKPQGLYFLMSYAAYELPFAWWWRCGWLSGLPVSADQTPCEAWVPKAWPDVVPEPETFDMYPEETAGKTKGFAGRMSPITVTKWLAKLNGVFTTEHVESARQSAHAAFVSSVQSWAFPDVYFACHASATIRPEFQSIDYLTRVQTVTKDAGQEWTFSTLQCKGAADCLNHGESVRQISRLLKAAMIARLLTGVEPSSCSECNCMHNMVPKICSFAVDAKFLSTSLNARTMPQDQDYIPLFTMAGSSTMPNAQDYDPLESGCNTFRCCEGAAGCSGSRQDAKASCKCLSATPMPSDISLAGVQLNPTTPPWIVFSDGPTPPTMADITNAENSASHVASGATWVAMDICKQSTPIPRCTLANAANPDVCSGAAGPAQTVRDLYCPATTATFGTDAQTEHCVQQKTDSNGLQCLDGRSIAGKYVFKNDMSTLELFSAANKACWTLTCGYHLKQFDRNVVFDKDPYTIAMTVRVNSRQVQLAFETHTMEHDYFGTWWDHNTIKNFVRLNQVELLIGKGVATPVKVLSYTTPDCTYSEESLPLAKCDQLSPLSRSRSSEYAREQVTNSMIQFSTDMTQAEMKSLVVQVVQQLEDDLVTNLDPAFQASTSGCKTKIPPNIAACTSKGTALKYVSPCSQEEFHAALRTRIVDLCAARYSDWKEDLSTARASHEADLRNCATNMQSSFAFAREIPDISECYNIQYEFLVPSVCSATKVDGGCPYSKAYAQTKTDAGLPNDGFCPYCTADCSTTSKGSSTYNLVDSITQGHQFTKATVVPVYPPESSSRLQAGQTASHFKVALNVHNNQQIKCGTPTKPSCGSSQHTVELYRNMFTCIGCFTVPSTYCTGNHMCAFERWEWPGAADLPGYDEHSAVFTNSTSSFQEVYAAMNWVIRSLITKSFPGPVGARPSSAEFLKTYGFAQFNPLSLSTIFNKNIEDLDGYCKDARALPDFSQCQNDQPRRTLRSFVEQQYKVSEGSVIPSKHTHTWNVDPAQMMLTNIPAWHVKSQLPFFETLFDDSVCKKGTLATLICFNNETTTLAMNPVLSGRFEVGVGCDTMNTGSSRVIDSICNAQACPSTRFDTTADEFNTFEGTVLTSLAAQMRCKMSNRHTALMESVPLEAAVNLCSKAPPQPSRCPMPQGVLGQATWDGAAASSVYQRGDWPGLYVPSGVLSQQNPLLQYQLLTRPTPGNITLDPGDIGGHYIRMVLQPSGVLVVAGMPLPSYSTTAQAVALSSMDWVGSWKAMATVESGLLMDQFAMRTCMSWDCPLRRRAFWTAQHKTFRPLSPNPFRSIQMYKTTTHPTTRPAPLEDGVLLRYRTRNGFCVCPLGDECLPVAGSCSEADTIASLTDRSFRDAKVMQTPCTQQVDWPWTGGTMRDGIVIARRASGCGVLDRLPMFQYRYHNSQTVLSTTTTTLDSGGDCHMGRPALLADSSDAKRLDSCTLVSKSDVAMVLDCNGSPVTLPRPMSQTVSLTDRTRCASCDPLPVFKASDGTVLPEAEVSYGKLWRWAPARKLAQDLRFRLCGNDTKCPKMKDLSIDDFWAHMMAGGITGTPTSNTVNSLFSSVPADPDDAAWAKPWMLCTNNGTGMDCQGSATKNQWLDDRRGTCNKIKSLPNSDSAVVSLTVCDLDSSLDYLCRVIQNARYNLFEANCRLSGKCRTSAFFYQPATFSISNDQFVRQTVQYYYNFSVPGSCPTFGDDVIAIKAQNERTVQECSSQSLEILQISITIARKVLYLFVTVCYYATEIALQIIGLISTTDPDPIIQNIMVSLSRLLAQFMQFFGVMGDLMYKMIMETGQLGKFIREMIQTICKFLRDIFQYALTPLICFFKEAIMALLSVVKGIMELLNFVSFGNLGGAVDDIEKSRTAIGDTFNCDLENPFNCDGLFPTRAGGASSLPMPTRCWVGYKPSVGDQDGLGCTPSDTCMDDDGSLRVCASCTGEIDMQRYGCDSLTKLCRCHTFPIGETQCMSHQECQLADTECGFVDTYLQPSFGNIQCARCSTQAVCLVTGGIGQCTCMLRLTPTQTCSAGSFAQRVSPDPTQLCLLSLGKSFAGNAEYAANWLDLSSTPCAILNGAQSWCLTVYLQNGGYAHMVVGLALLGRRRLLSMGVYEPNVTQWRDAHEPCRSLMLGDNLTILERHYASECERWRLIGERAVLMYNLTAKPVQFTSYLGMSEASITPTAYFFLFKHADWAQPAFVLARRYWHNAIPIINATMRLVKSLKMTAEAENLKTQVFVLMPWFAMYKKNDTADRPENASYNNTSYNSTAAMESRRRLLGWKENIEAVKQYTVEIAEGSIANLAPSLAAEWSKGPFYWPPSYNYRSREHICLAGELTWTLSYNTMLSTGSYYSKTGPPRPVVARTFREALPSLPGMLTDTPRNGPGLITSFKAVMKSLVGLDMSAIKRYATSPDNLGTASQLSQDLTDLIRCDFEKVQHCTGQRRSLFWGAIIVALFLVCTSVLLRTLGIPMVDVLLAATFVPLTLLFVFNYSVTCAPLVPTCLMDELLDIMQMLIPAAIYWPTQLQQWPDCVNGSVPLTPTGAVDYLRMGNVLPGTQECFRDCNEWPFDFRSWEDNAHWIACELGYCGASLITDHYQPLVELLPLPSVIYSLVHMDRYVTAARIKPTFMQWDDMRDAQRVCCFFTVFNLVPVILMSVVIVMAAMALVAVLVALVQSSVNTMAALFTYIHT